MANPPLEPIVRLLRSDWFLVTAQRQSVSRYNCHVIDKVIRFSMIPMQARLPNRPEQEEKSWP